MKRPDMQRTLLAVVLAASCFLAPAGAAQGFSYTSTTRIEIPGRWGAILNSAASLTGMNDMEETIRVLGDRMCVERGGTSTITDLEWQTITTLHRDDRTFGVVSFDSLLARMESARDQLDAADFAMEEAGVNVETDEGVVRDTTTGVTFDFQVEQTGQKKRIDRLPAEQVLLTLVAEVVGNEGDETALKGTFVAVNDMWLTPEIDGFQEVQAFERKAGELLGTALFDKGGLEKLQSTLVRDPRMEAMMARAREESKKIQGVPVLTDTYLVLVPPGDTFDRNLVFNKKKERRGLQGALRAARRIAQGQEEESPGQQTLLRISIELKDFSAGGLTDDDFTPPADYTELATGS